MNKLPGPAYLLAFATLLVAMAAGAPVGLVQAHRSANWPIVEGWIESSSFVQGCGLHRTYYPAVVAYP